MKHSFSCLIKLLNLSLFRIFNAIARIVFDFNTFFTKVTSFVFFCLEKLIRLRACGGGPQVGEVTSLDGVTRLSVKSLILT